MDTIGEWRQGWNGLEVMGRVEGGRRTGKSDVGADITALYFTLTSQCNSASQFRAKVQEHCNSILQFSDLYKCTTYISVVKSTTHTHNGTVGCAYSADTVVRGGGSGGRNNKAGTWRGGGEVTSWENSNISSS